MDKITEEQQALLNQLARKICDKLVIKMEKKHPEAFHNYDIDCLILLKEKDMSLITMH